MSLYHNLGNGKFEDVTRKTGLDPTAHGIGCTAGDYDNDGFADLAVTLKDRPGPVGLFPTALLLLHNEKNSTFKDVTEASGVRSEWVTGGPNFIDYDHDGDIDLIVQRSMGRRNAPFTVTGGTGSEGELLSTNVVWRNNGNGRF